MNYLAWHHQPPTTTDEKTCTSLADAKRWLLARLQDSDGEDWWGIEDLSIPLTGDPACPWLVLMSEMVRERVAAGEPLPEHGPEHICSMRQR